MEVNVIHIQVSIGKCKNIEPNPICIDAVKRCLVSLADFEG